MRPASKPIERWLAPAIDDAGVEAAWQRIRAGRGKRARAIRRAGFGVAALAAAAAAIAFAMWPRGEPPVLACGSIEAALPRRVPLAGNSALELEPGARLQVLSTTPEHVVAALPRGRVRLDLHAAQRWDVEIPHATIEVADTQVTIQADAHRVVVAVVRGTVTVRGDGVPGGSAHVAAGETLTIADEPAKPERIADVELPAPPTSVQAPLAPAPPPVAPAPPLPAPSPRPLPRSPRASPPASIIATFAPAPPTPATIDALVAAADARRAAGDPSGAAGLLASASELARDAETRGRVELSLGGLYLDELGDPERADAAFVSVIAIGAPSALIEAASARRVEALARAHRAGAAADALADLEQRYPDDPHIAALHALLAARP